MRVGYLVMGAGLAIRKWPEFVSHQPWELKEGTVLTMLVAMSVLALERSNDEQVRTLARDILLTQQQQVGQMHAWLQAWSLPQTTTTAAMTISV